VKVTVWTQACAGLPQLSDAVYVRLTPVPLKQHAGVTVLGASQLSVTVPVGAGGTVAVQMLMVSFGPQLIVGPFVSFTVIVWLN
jgi:hypothetical protein